MMICFNVIMVFESGSGGFEKRGGEVWIKWQG